MHQGEHARGVTVLRLFIAKVSSGPGEGCDGFWRTAGDDLNGGGLAAFILRAGESASSSGERLDGLHRFVMMVRSAAPKVAIDRVDRRCASTRVLIFSEYAAGFH